MFIREIIKNKNLRNGSLFVFYSFLNQGLNFLLMIVLSWYILPASFGKLNLYYTGINILSVFICLCTSGFININFYRVNRERLCRYINVTLICTAVVSVVLLFCIILFNYWIEKYSGIEFRMQFLCVFTCATSVLYVILTNIYRLEEKVISYGFVTIISTILNISTTLFLVIVLSWDWYGRAASNALISFLFFLVAIYFLRRKGYLMFIKPSKEDYKESLAYGVPLIPHSINGWLRQGVDRYVINGFFSATQVGLFSFSITFSTIIYTIGIAFNQSNSAYIFKVLSKDPDGIKKQLRKQTLLMIAFFGVVTLLLNILCIVLFPFAFPKYQSAITYLFPLSMGAFFQCVYLQFCNYIFYFKKTKQLMYMTFSVSIIHMSLSLFLTQYSVVLTAYVSMISSFIEALIIFIYSRKLYKII